MDCLSRSFLLHQRERFARLYGKGIAQRTAERLALLVGRYGLSANGEASARPSPGAVLITYGDMISAPGMSPLRALKQFLDEYLVNAFASVHVLPFFPYSSDDGFSVIHYRTVDPALGSWSDLRALGERFGLMVDLVLNHVSRRSPWFQDFVTDCAPGRDFFITVDPSTDLSAVTRPRSHPLLTPISTRRGTRHVWTTFSDDQMDLNYAQPDVLFELLDILLFYISMGACLIRLDAIAYLWKTIGTTCIHLPETHEVLRLMRDVINLAAPGVQLVAEVNAPHEENAAYLGDGDEAHMVYQFSLPPLLLHTLRTGSAEVLTRWAAALDAPPPGCTYLNFTASHDGVGVRPAEGWLSAQEMEALTAAARACGGLVSLRRNPDGTESPYELNLAWPDAMRMGGPTDAESVEKKLLLSQAVAMTLRGIPAIYFNTLLVAPNDTDAVQSTGRARSINRHKWTRDEIDRRLGPQGDPLAVRTLKGLLHLLRARNQLSAFHPDAQQQILDIHPAVFAVERTTADGAQAVTALFNVSADPVSIHTNKLGKPDASAWLDAASGTVIRPTGGAIMLAPYDFFWLVPQST